MEGMERAGEPTDSTPTSAQNATTQNSSTEKRVLGYNRSMKSVARPSIQKKDKLAVAVQYKLVSLLGLFF